MFLQIPAKMWYFIGRICMLLSFAVFFKFEILLLSFFSVLFVPNLFENNHQSSWWSTCLILMFGNRRKIHMTTSPKKGGSCPVRPRLNPLLRKFVISGS